MLRSRRLRCWLIGSLITVAILAAMMARPLIKFHEFYVTEQVKGYWLSLHDFEKEFGRFPKDDEELAAYVHETPKELKSEPVEYVPPHDINSDEVVLWWKKTTVSGVRVGIVESGTVVKK